MGLKIYKELTAEPNWRYHMAAGPSKWLVRSAGLRIHFSAWGCPDKQILNAFRNTWRGIPLAARRILREHWRNPRPNSFLQSFALSELPVIVLCPCEEDCWSVGLCAQNGCAFFFDCDVLEMESDGFAAAIFAHEMAHAYLRATQSGLHEFGIVLNPDATIVGGDERQQKESANIIRQRWDELHAMADRYMPGYGYAPRILAEAEACAVATQWGFSDDIIAEYDEKMNLLMARLSMQ